MIWHFIHIIDIALWLLWQLQHLYSILCLGIYLMEETRFQTDHIFDRTSFGHAEKDYFSLSGSIPCL